MDSTAEGKIIAAMPASARALVGALGFLPALDLLRQFGGVRLYVPTKTTMEAGRELVKALGPETAQAFIALHGGRHFHVPRMSSVERHLRNAALCTDFDLAMHNGAARTDVVGELIVRYRLNYQTVRRILGKQRAATTRGRPPRAVSGVR